MHQWFPVTPHRVRAKSHPWVFAYYVQPPEQRADGKWHHALVFRTEDRTEFGSFEVVDEKIDAAGFERRYDMRRIAAVENLVLLQHKLERRAA